MARKEAPSYAGLSVVIGIISVAIGGGYWYYEYNQKQQKQRAREGRKQFDRSPVLSMLPMPPSAPPPISITTPPSTVATKIPAAQSVPVPPPSVAVIKQMQNYLNFLSGKKPGDKGYLKEDGSAGPATNQALKDFQAKHGMEQTGKFDAMTLGMVTNEAAKSYQERNLPPMVSFLIAWDEPTHSWTAKDGLGFVTHLDYSDRQKPPLPSAVADVLKQHYGPSSSMGKSLEAGRYNYDCLDCHGL